MKRVLALVFLLLLLLTGCAGTPQSRESGATAVVSVLGGSRPARAFTFWRLRRAGGRRSPSAVTARGRPRPLPWRA